MKKVLIVGCGAIGSLFAAHLAKGGEVEVYAFDVSQAACRGDQSQRTAAVGCFRRACETGEGEPAIRPSYRSAIMASSRPRRFTPPQRVAAAAPCFDADSAVCSVQNGVGNEEIIAEHVKYVIRGTTFPAGHIVEPGHVGFDIKVTPGSVRSSRRIRR